MIESTIIYTDYVHFEMTEGDVTYRFEVPNSLLEEIAEYVPEEASEPLDYGAVFEDHTEHFHEVAKVLISQKPEEGFLIVISPENYYI